MECPVFDQPTTTTLSEECPFHLTNWVPDGQLEDRGGESGGRAGGDDDLGGAEEFVAQLPAAAGLGDDGAFGDVGGGDVGDGFVEVGVEGLSGGVDGGDVRLGEGGFKLGADEAEAFEKGGRGAGFLAVGKAQVEGVEGGQEVAEELFVGEHGPVLALAVDALAVVVEIGLEAEKAVLENVFGGGDGFCDVGNRFFGGLDFRSLGGGGFGRVVGLSDVSLFLRFGRSFGLGGFFGFAGMRMFLHDGILIA